MTSSGYSGYVEGEEPKGDITFYVENALEILTLKSNGDILVKGKLIENDKEVVDALREFIEKSQKIS